MNKTIITLFVALFFAVAFAIGATVSLNVEVRRVDGVLNQYEKDRADMYQHQKSMQGQLETLMHDLDERVKAENDTTITDNQKAYLYE